MRSDFMLAINQLCAERKLSPEVVLEAVEASLISAYRRNFGAANNVEVKIEPNSGDVRVYAAKTVVEIVADPKIEISLEEARRLDPNAEVGQEIRIESTPKDFGRIAAQTAKQVILQRIREAEREAVYNSFADSAGEIAHGTIQSVDYHSGDVIVNLDRAEAILPVREQVPSERYRRGSRLRAYVLDVRRGSRGPQITLSRRTPDLLRRLLELEVPEIFNGVVEIKGIAREAGSRSKVAVYATQPGVDPVGSCVGVRGGRIQNVVNELGGEKIDVVQWDPDTAVFIANALSPAKVMNVLLDNNPENGKTATVIVPDRQLSLAIGKEGQNARLAAKLTGWRIDIKSATEATEETWGKLEDIPVPPDEMDLLALAEKLLRQRDEAGFSEEEQEKIEAEVAQADELLDWPEQPPETKPAAEAEAEEAKETQLPLEEPEVEPPEAADEEAAPPPVREEVEEPPAELPSFEDETVDDSLGWIRTEPEEPYMWGWGEPEEEAPAEEDKKDWVLDDLEEEARRKPPKKKKKRGKKRKDDFDEIDWDWRAYSR